MTIRPKVRAATAALLLITTVFLISDFVRNISRPQFRYNNFCPLLTGMNRFGGKTVDYVFFGSSRFLRAMNADAFTELYSQIEGRDVSALDLSRSHRGKGLTYVMAKELFQRATVKDLIVEYNATVPGYPVHLQFAKIARFSDIFYDMTMYPNLLTGLEYGFHNLRSKISDGIRYTIELRRCYDSELVEMHPSETSVPEQLYERRDFFEKHGLPDDPVAIELDTKEEYRQVKYTHKLIELATAHGAKIHFVYTPRFLGRVPGTEFQENFLREFGHRLSVPPPEVIIDIGEHDGHLDSSHMKLSGSKKYMRWIIEQVLNGRQFRAELGPH